MRIGDFEIDEPVPELKMPHAFVTLRPWVDVGKVGRHTLARLEKHTGAKEFGRLARPGNYYDFTRYRPRMTNVGSERRVTIPNTTVQYANREEPPDFLFFHLLEPHAFGEDYVDSVLEVLRHFQVTRYTQVGGMSDAVPHTRPLLVSGAVPGDIGKGYGVHRSNYQGPTSIADLVPQEASKLGIETMGFLVHLPHYAQLDEDHAGVGRLMEVLCSLYGLPTDLIDPERGQRQYNKINDAVARSSQMASLVQQLEASYDAKNRATSKENAALAPEVEKFLLEMAKRLDDDPV